MWLQEQHIECRGIILVTDSQSMLKKIEKGQLRQEWHQSIGRIGLQSIKWIFCPGHSGVGGNVEADKLAGQAVVNCSVSCDRRELLQILEQKLREEEESQDDNHNAIERMKEMGIQRGSARTCTLAGRERRYFNQRATGTISVYTLRALLLRGTEQIWTCPSCNDVGTVRILRIIEILAPFLRSSKLGHCSSSTIDVGLSVCFKRPTDSGVVYIGYIGLANDCRFKV